MQLKNLKQFTLNQFLIIENLFSTTFEKYLKFKVLEKLFFLLVTICLKINIRILYLFT